ncbi:MAG: phosphoesterase [Acidithiobacillales bacterium SG8_45]|nr:MAG: phosphoesterase [Acidithiobacillales bacterium SG8_45]
MLCSCVMSKRFDLHSHTLRSDGVLTPTELVQRAAEKGVDVLALTDHDVTDGIAEASAAASEAGIELIPGVEVSVSWEGRTIHVVGLAIDPANTELDQGLARLRAMRNERGRDIGERLERAGVENAHAGASEYAQGEILSRTHFARFLVDRGYAADVGKAFRDYLRKGKPGHVRNDWVSLEQGVSWIRAAGGTAVIAHPARYKMSAGAMRRMLGEFRESGGHGVEVVCGNYNAAEAERFARLAREFDLLSSCGSDFHGPEQHWLELGKLAPFPAGCIPVWERWAA